MHNSIINKTMNQIVSRLKLYSNYVPQILKIYITWMILHYISAILYNRWCVPKTLYDAVLIPFTFHTPQCKILQWGFTTSTGSINQIIVIIISKLNAKISVFFLIFILILLKMKKFLYCN